MTSELCEVVLEANSFEGNYAANKGGALRYINRNFTTVYNSDNKRMLSGGRIMVD